MVLKFRVIPLDAVSLVLTIVATSCQFGGLFVGPWWENVNKVGRSLCGMLQLRICKVTCVERSVLNIDGDREWVFLVRIFEVFGGIFVAVALVLAVLTIVVRKRPILTAIIYMHGAAALFILVGVFSFLGLNHTLKEGMEGESTLLYPFWLCVVAGVICIVTSVVCGFSLKKHLLESVDDEEEEEQLNEQQP